MRRLLVPIAALLLGVGGLITPTPASAGAEEPASALAPEPAPAPDLDLIMITTLAAGRIAERGVQPRILQKTVEAEAEEPAPAPAPELATVAEPAPAPEPALAPASVLGGEVSLEEAQAQASSLFGGGNTDVRIEADYQSAPGQTNSRASVTLAPQGQPFLVQVTGEQTTGTCPAGPGGSCEYDSRRLDVYGAWRGWSPTTDWNVGPFVRFQDNITNGTWRSPDDLYSGSWKSDNSQTDIGIRGRLRHRLAPGSNSNPWIGVGGEYDFANGGYDAFGEGGIRPGNSENPWNLYVQAGVNSDGGYFYPEITTPNLIGDANSKLQVQLQAKGVFYALGRDNSSSRVELGLPLTLNVSRNTAIQVVPAYVFGLDPNTRSGFGGAVRLRIGF